MAMLSDQFRDKTPSTPGPGKQTPAAPLSTQFSDPNLQTNAAATTEVPDDNIVSRAGTAIGNAVPLLGELGASILQGGRDIRQTIDAAGNWLGEKLAPGVPIPPDIAAEQARTAAATQAYAASPAAASIPGMLGRYGTQMAIAAPLLPEIATPAGAGLLSRTLYGAGRGALAGGGTNLLASGGMGEDPTTAGLTGAAGGAILGPLAEGAGAVLGSVKQPLIDAARRLGIDLTTGQRMGGLTQWVEDASKLNPISGQSAADTRLQTQIANVIRREGGMGGTGAIDTQDILQGLQGAGNRIGTAVQGASIPASDNAMWSDLLNVGNNATAGGGTSAQANYFRTLVGELRSRMIANGGSLSGNDLQTMIQLNRPLQNAMSSQDGEVQRVGQGVYDALMNAAERNNPGVTSALRQARYQYKVLATAQPQILRSVGGTESMSNLGFARNIDQSFNQPVLNPTVTTGPGSNAMNDLAHVIRGTQPLRSSGTAERIAMMGALPTAAGGLVWALNNPHQAEQAAIYGVPSFLGLGLGGRAMRFAPNLMTAAGQGVNRLVQAIPQAFGPWAGRTGGNLLGGNYQPAPGAPPP